MTRIERPLAAVVLLALALFMDLARARPRKPRRLRRRKNGPTCSARRHVTFHYVIRSDEALAGRLNWSLSVNRRTIDRGQCRLTVRPEKPARGTLPLRIPPVKDGVILERS